MEALEAFDAVVTVDDVEVVGDGGSFGGGVCE